MTELYNYTEQKQLFEDYFSGGGLHFFGLLFSPKLFKVNCLVYGHKNLRSFPGMSLSVQYLILFPTLFFHLSGLFLYCQIFTHVFISSNLTVRKSLAPPEELHQRVTVCPGAMRFILRMRIPSSYTVLVAAGRVFIDS